jgi:hypothetical protein
MRVAAQTLHVGTHNRSFVTLPVVPRGAGVEASDAFLRPSIPGAIATTTEAGSVLRELHN